MLKMNWTNIRRRTHQSLIPNLKCSMAQFKTLIKNFPKLRNILLRATSNIYQIDGDNTGIKATIILVALLPIHGTRNILGGSIRSQEAATSHTGVASTFVLKHLLLRNVVRYESLGSTFSCQFSQIVILRIISNVVFFQHINQFWESRSNPCTSFIFHTFNALTKNFFNDNCKVITGLAFRNFI